MLPATLPDVAREEARADSGHNGGEERDHCTYCR